MIPYEYIAIEGNIGSGKTSLSRMLAADFNAKLILEEFEDNPFLPSFYQDPERYAFPLELFFLAERFQQLSQQLTNRELFHPFTVADYMVYKSMIFSRANLGEAEYSLYSRLFQIMLSSLPKPELLVFLYLPVKQLLANIKKRGRGFEQDIQPEYLEKVQQSYLEFFRQQTDMRILVVDTSKLDFVNRPEDYQYMVRLIGQQWDTGIHRITAEGSIA